MSVVMAERTGTTELTASADGYRTSSEVWAGPLRPRRHPGPEGGFSDSVFPTAPASWAVSRSRVSALTRGQRLLKATLRTSRTPPTSSFSARGGLG